MAYALTLERLKELLEYDPDTGIFIWKVKRQGTHKGAVAGCRDTFGHIRIMIDRVSYGAHRLSWLYMTGNWPKDEIDHRDCDPANNKFKNLREATPSQNSANIRVKPKNTSGFKGVTLHKSTGKWQSSIKTAGKTTYLGMFARPEDAHAAYCAEAARRYAEFSRAA